MRAEPGGRLGRGAPREKSTTAFTRRLISTSSASPSLAKIALACFSTEWAETNSDSRSPSWSLPSPSR